VGPARAHQTIRSRPSRPAPSDPAHPADHCAAHPARPAQGHQAAHSPPRHPRPSDHSASHQAERDHQGRHLPARSQAHQDRAAAADHSSSCKAESGPRRRADHDGRLPRRPAWLGVDVGSGAAVAPGPAPLRPPSGSRRSARHLAVCGGPHHRATPSAARASGLGGGRADPPGAWSADPPRPLPLTDRRAPVDTSMSCPAQKTCEPPPVIRRPASSGCMPTSAIKLLQLETFKLGWPTVIVW
jgi:hypothetical protein